MAKAAVGESSFRSLMVVVQRCAICVSSSFYLYLFGDGSILQEESVTETRIIFLFSLINSRANISYGHNRNTRQCDIICKKEILVHLKRLK